MVPPFVCGAGATLAFSNPNLGPAESWRRGGEYGFAHEQPAHLEQRLLRGTSCVEENTGFPGYCFVTPSLENKRPEMLGFEEMIDGLRP
jgi:hypothetical protein